MFVYCFSCFINLKFLLLPPTSPVIVLSQWVLAIYAIGIFPALQTHFCFYCLFTFLLLTPVAGQHVLAIILLEASLISSI